MPGLFYRRNLPHWQPDGRILFVTWRLNGSLPSGVASARHSSKEFTGRDFRRLDRALDTATTGPTWLKNPSVADCVSEALLHGSEILLRYELHAWVVMANHVHMLMRPIAPMPEITQGIKGYTARRANEILGRRGTFWQDESFDHWIRNEAEFSRVHSYIERNPVMAGLVTTPKDWPWSSARVTQAVRPVHLPSRPKRTG